MKKFGILALMFTLFFTALIAVSYSARAQETPSSGVYQGVSTAVQFDVSPPLRDSVPLDVNIDADKGVEIPERATGLEGDFGPQDVDPLVQSSKGPNAIPAPSVSFDALSNIGGFSPPDPVGDVGPNHYVAMSNVYFAVYDKTGTVLLGPSPNNTLWAGFGGDCETDNAGDPIVLYDQISDRWMLSQFTSSGPTYFNCVAVSTTPDPTGTYYRWAFSTGSNFPDYPKYGFWSDALYISTREFAGASFAGMGAYAINRAELIAGNPAPQVISFLVAPGATPYNIGDGLLPSDLDGTTLPPAGTPNFFVGSMDNGGPYGAPQDALTIWKFRADFAVPANSTFTLANTVPVAAFDSAFPCTPGSRDCIPQPGTSQKLDVLSYRQRPLWRLAYRNFGTHESLVTNQTVEAAANIAGIRWYELRDPNGTPTIYQQGTYAPGVSDGTHRWMGSVAMDQSGNMALGYSASDATTTFPSIWYTGRLAGDPLGTMPQGEGSIIDGTGSQTGSARWGDYTSMNVDPVDDCTFWYVNEYVPVSSSVGWRLRVGSFKFDECGSPDFTLSVTPDPQAICAPATADYDVIVGSILGYTDSVTLSTPGLPAGLSSSFGTNPVTPPFTTTLTIDDTNLAAAGSYNIAVVGIAPTSTHTVTVGLDLFTAVPTAPLLTAPANGSNGVSTLPTFTWNAASQASSYLLEVATDAGFTNVVYTTTVNSASHDLPGGSELDTSTTYFWRVTASNSCGDGSTSSTYLFTTASAPGDCAIDQTPNILFTDDFESGAVGWSSSGTGNTWALGPGVSGTPHSGSNVYHADDVGSVTDQYLDSPTVVLPTGESPLSLQFWNFQQIEDNATTACYDGAVLEITNNGGSTWTRLESELLTDPYDGLVSSSFSNPLAGDNAWCGDPQNWLNSIVDLNAYAGDTVQFRFRMATDSSVSHPGWDVDDVVVQSCQAGNNDVMVSADVTTDSGDPGSAVTYSVMISNTGTVTDTYDVLVTGNNWPTAADAMTVTLAANTGVLVDVTVDIPTDTAAGAMDAAAVTALSQNVPSVNDTVALTTTVNTVYDVLLVADTDAISDEPGNVVTYTVDITNSGNVTSTFTLSAVDDNGWTSQVSASSISLDAGESGTVLVLVLVPTDAADGAINVTTLTAVSDDDSSATDSVALTTTADVPGFAVYLPVISKP